MLDAKELIKKVIKEDFSPLIYLDSFHGEISSSIFEKKEVNDLLMLTLKSFSILFNTEYEDKNKIELLLGTYNSESSFKKTHEYFTPRLKMIIDLDLNSIFFGVQGFIDEVHKYHKIMEI